jgi:hypothetical protein
MNNSFLDKSPEWVFNVPTLNQEAQMTNATLKALREIGSTSGKWEWVSKPNRMVNLTEARAKEYAKVYGGTAKEMK